MMLEKKLLHCRWKNCSNPFKVVILAKLKPVICEESKKDIQVNFLVTLHFLVHMQW